MSNSERPAALEPPSSAPLSERMADGSQPPATQWTPAAVAVSVALFIAAAFAEIGGGWLMWQTLRVKRPWYFALFGSFALVAYGIVPTWQPTASFGRVYAAYGGFFILLSYAWGWAVDREMPDRMDFIGTAIALVGVLIAYFWPR